MDLGLSSQFPTLKGHRDVVGIVVVSHGLLAEGLKNAAEMIVGQQERFRALGMDPAADLDRLRSEIEAAVADVANPDGALVLVDMMGGSPSNASAYLATSGTPVVCGVNLPILLEILMVRESSTASDLAELALQTGKESILNLGDRLRGAGG
ncbi:MAG TPA: PTS sugar transporter subunit IIA [Ktedonobacterales bacterium]